MQLKMPYDVFLAYSREDSIKVELLAQALESNGCSVFWDHNEFLGHDEWDLMEVLRDIAEPFSIVVIWSQVSLNAENVLKAAEHGLGLGKLLQICIEQITLPSPFDQLDCADFSKWNGNLADSEFVFFWEAVSAKLIHAKGKTQGSQTLVTDGIPLITRKSKLLPDIDWVEIPQGIYILENTGTRVLDKFFISRYPITHCQYQTFINAAGYQEARWWRDLIRPDPESAVWSQSNRPRDSVNWYEAVAFCRWLSAQLGYEIKLPSEAQWKIAAYGPEQFEYPWGQEDLITNANMALDESTGLNQTCAVGLFPQGASPYGVMDMAGNLWEWCDDVYPQTPPADPAQPARVLQGGSWDSPLSDAHITAYRGQHPEWGTQDVGFRVVCQSPK